MAAPTLSLAAQVDRLNRYLRDGGFTVISCHDGEHRYIVDRIPADMADVDILRVQLRPAGWLLLVAGNDPGELVADYGDLPDLETVVSAYADSY